ncbi:glucosaminidase domain-containing protein [Komagataeibacter diospyri]|uniref:glucosaminidase domain-containing protein n=1 Tax=Komagataeibacter diospyri TaxID=1932662 RepID=UPI001142DC80
MLRDNHAGHPRQDDVRGVPASITIAQWMLESGFGQHMPPHFNNPFGIKASRDQNFVMTPTHEETRDHRLLSTMAPFRVFSSINEAFDLHYTDAYW